MSWKKFERYFFDSIVNPILHYHCVLFLVNSLFRVCLGSLKLKTNCRNTVVQETLSSQALIDIETDKSIILKSNKLFLFKLLKKVDILVKSSKFVNSTTFLFKTTTKNFSYIFYFNSSFFINNVKKYVYTLH